MFLTAALLTLTAHACQTEVREINSCSGRTANGVTIEAEYDKGVCGSAAFTRAYVVIHAGKTSAFRVRFPDELTPIAVGAKVFNEPITASFSNLAGEVTGDDHQLKIDVTIDGAPLQAQLTCAPQGGD